MKQEITEQKKAKSANKLRIKIDADKWSDVKLDDTLDLTGKRLHLFQLPHDMPVSCLDGIELPIARKSKWTKPVTVSYTSNKGGDNERLRTVELKAIKMKGDETLMQVRNGGVIPCKNSPISLFQGCEVLDDEEVILPEICESIHQLPEGLRQRFTPIGNRTSQRSHVDVSQIVSKDTAPDSQKRKRKSTTPKIKESLDMSQAVTDSPRKRRRVKEEEEEDASEQMTPQKKSKRSINSPKKEPILNSSAKGSPKKSKKVR